MDRLTELLAWMRLNGILSATVDGVSITLPYVDMPEPEIPLDNGGDLEYTHPYNRADFGAPSLTATAPQPSQADRRGKSTGS
jgi:hypothetical protein